MDAKTSQAPKLLDQVRGKIRLKHYSYRTEQSYVHWIKRFILFHGKRHPADMGAAEVEAFLSHLATDREVAAGTQNQAKHAVLFLYKEVLGVDLPWLTGITSAKASRRLPVVLTQVEVTRLLSHTRGLPGLIVQLLYGTGMRLMEALRLRVKDVDLQRRQIVIRGGKGDKDRVTMLPESLVAPLQARLAERRKMHDIDLAKGLADVELPTAIARKYPGAGREWAWQYIFAAPGYSAPRFTHSTHSACRLRHSPKAEAAPAAQPLTS